MRAEYRSQVNAQYVRKIEQIVRRPSADEADIEESASPSPYDPSALVPDTQLECPTTRNLIPYCVATGRHIVLHDLCVCPSCAFPAIYSAFTRLISQMDDHACPMCSQHIALETVRKFEEVEAAEWLKNYRARTVDKGDKK
jgi:WD repeat-containing protein 19